MKRVILFIGFLMATFLMFSVTAKAQPVTRGVQGPAYQADRELTEIQACVQSGDADRLLKYLADNVEISLPDKHGNYAKSQAKFILKEFFGANPAGTFTIVQKDASGIIGSYVAEKGTMDVNIFFIKRNAVLQIDRIRFDKRRY